MADESIGRIVVNRVAGRRVDRLRRYTLLVDDQQRGKLQAGERLVIDVAPGVHDVRLRIDWAGSRRLPVQVEAGDTVEFQCEPSPPDERTLSAGLRILKALTIGRNDWIALRPV